MTRFTSGFLRRVCLLLGWTVLSAAGLASDVTLFSVQEDVFDPTWDDRAVALSPADASPLGWSEVQLPSGMFWRDATGSPADPNAVFVVGNNLGGGRGGLPPAGPLVRVDVLTGAWNTIVLTLADTVEQSSLGIHHAVAFDPRDPDLGYLALGSAPYNGPAQGALARFRLGSRQIEQIVATAHVYEALAVLDDGTLLGAVDFFDPSRSGPEPGTAEVYQLDAATGASVFRFDSGFRQLSAFALDPTDGSLFAVNASPINELVVIDPVDGGVVRRAGGLPAGWTNGLAFVTMTDAALGDFNGNGEVEQGDLDMVLQNWGRDAAVSGVPDGWSNLRPDGVVDQAELDAVLQRWGAVDAPDFRGFDPATLPEPAAAGVLLALVALLPRRG